MNEYKIGTGDFYLSPNMQKSQAAIDILRKCRSYHEGYNFILIF